MKFLATISLTVMFLFLCSCTNKSPLGSRENPIKFFFTPSNDADTIMTNATDLVQFLEKDTGLYFTTAVPTSYVAVVEAFGSNRADIAVMNTFSYLLSNERYDAQARMTMIRHGSNVYYGQIIAHVDSGINKIEDIAGKKFAFVDAASASAYLFPLKMLKDKNVEPANTVFAMKHDNVVSMIYQKQVDAGATYYSPPVDGVIKDARARVLTQYPDVEKKIKIIEITEPILNDPLVFAKNMPEDLIEKVIASMQKFLSTPEGVKAFENIYSMQGMVPATDKDYDGLREMIRVNKISPEDLFK